MALKSLLVTMAAVSAFAKDSCDKTMSAAEGATSREHGKLKEKQPRSQPQGYNRIEASILSRDFVAQSCYLFAYVHSELPMRDAVLR
jgi:hypothetical protein